MADSAAFDWPGGDLKEFTMWMNFYLEFLSIATAPGSYTARQLQTFLESFMALPAPDERDYEPSVLDDAGTVISGDTYLSARTGLTGVTSFVGDEGAILSGGRTRARSGTVVFSPELLEEVESFAVSQSETLDVAMSILTELFFGAGDDVVGWLTGSSNVAEYRERFFTGAPEPVEQAADESGVGQLSAAQSGVAQLSLEPTGASSQPVSEPGAMEVDSDTAAGAAGWTDAVGGRLGLGGFGEPSAGGGVGRGVGTAGGRCGHPGGGG